MLALERRIVKVWAPGHCVDSIFAAV